MDRNPAYNKAMEQFVDLWGDMASAWGINKTMAQIHALLYAESELLDTDTIMARLSISRGNANMNLRRLLDWELIGKEQIPGDRKDYYSAETDVWKIVSTIIRERQQQEIAPIRTELAECLKTLESGGLEDKESREFKERIENYSEFLEMFERFTGALLPYINKKNLGFIKQLVKLVEVKDSLKDSIRSEQ
ncbi:GbsR/MarR family transcriptional regulator [Balneola sp. MJW-20]|uniref:GbsR/MarR family transcriptional regulator n=1 Tax=Gracilimonas aurantiaca TaxID=3234185 RepID=UPI0034664860